MDCIWTHGPLSSEDCREALRFSRPMKDSTIRTVLRRLEEKGYLTHQTQGRTFIYRASHARQNVAMRAVKGIIDRFCGGSAEELVLGMVDNAVLSRKQLERLARKIDANTGEEKTSAEKASATKKGKRPMMILIAVPASSTLLLQLIPPAARTIALSGMLAFGLTVFRVKAPSLRLFTWTAVLYAALAMPLLEWMLPPLPIPTPAFLQTSLPKSEGARRGPNKSGLLDAGQSAIGRSGVTTVTSAPASRARTEMASLGLFKKHRSTPLLSIWSSFTWSAFAAAIYLTVALIFLGRFSVGLAFARRLLLASLPIAETRLTTRLASQARAAGLTSSSSRGSVGNDFSAPHHGSPSIHDSVALGLARMGPGET